jgi:RsiW-degrading membrane proteinase PrsW (M82 family)
MLIAIFISLLAAIVPTLLYVLLFYWADRYEREPRWLVMVAFFWGAIPAIIISLISELWIGDPTAGASGPLISGVVSDSLVAPIIEEVVKGAALFAIFLLYRQEFDGVLDGLIYGALVGFGFAMTENLLYFLSAYFDGGFGSLTALIFLRTVLFGLNHAFYTSLTGIGIGIARNKRSFLARFLWCAVGLMAAILAHSLHNLGASLAEVNFASFLISLIVAGCGLAITMIAIGLSWQQERNIISAELAPEVGQLLTEEEYGQLTEQWRRPDRTKRLPTAQRRQLLVEYANRRYRLHSRGLAREPELAQELADLHTQLVQSYSPA